jgi:plastocyanin
MKELRERVLIPLAVPLAALAIIVVVVLNFSRVLLAVEGEVATIVAILVASSVLFGCAYVSSRDEEGRSATNLGVLAVAGMVLVFSGLAGLARINEERSEAAAEKAEKEPAGPPDVTIRAFDLGLDPKQATAPAGDVRIEYVNDGTLQHTLLLDNVGGFKLAVGGKGAKDDGKVKLDPGSYTFYCDIPGHRAAGMEGTLTVTPGGGGGETAGGGAGVALEAGDLFLKPKELKAAPGTVQINYKNTGALQHTLMVEEEPKFKKLMVDAGKTVSGTLQVGPGTYTLFCDVPGHRAAGMEAKLVVG